MTGVATRRRVDPGRPMRRITPSTCDPAVRVHASDQPAASQLCNESATAAVRGQTPSYAAAMDQTVATRVESLGGAVVTQLRVDNAFTLAFDSEPPHLLWIEGGFTYRDPAGVEHRFDDEYPRTAIGSTLGLVGATVAALEISPDGALTLEFESGARTPVPVITQFKARTRSAPGAATRASPPGRRAACPTVEEYGCHSRRAAHSGCRKSATRVQRSPFGVRPRLLDPESGPAPGQRGQAPRHPLPVRCSLRRAASAARGGG